MGYTSASDSPSVAAPMRLPAITTAPINYGTVVPTAHTKEIMEKLLTNKANVFKSELQRACIERLQVTDYNLFDDGKEKSFV